MFITFEGIDLSGKSTQMKLLENYLKKKKKKVISVREPGGTEVSENIREILLDKKQLNMDSMTEFLLFSASRYQLTKEIILPYLKKKYFVLCDRYFDSSTAYQGYGGELDLKVIHYINQIASNGITPHITFLISISIAEYESRCKAIGKVKDRIELKKVSYYKKVIKGYDKIAENKKRKFVVIDGKLSIPEIHREIIDTIESTN